MKAAAKWILSVAGLAAVMPLASGCGPKTPDASDPSSKTNAMKVVPNAGAGSPSPGGSTSGVTSNTAKGAAAAGVKE